MGNENNKQTDPLAIEEVKDKVLTKDNDILAVLKESLTLDPVRLPVLARLKKRLKHLENLSRAKTIKVPIALGAFNHFETEPPKVFMSGLEARYDGRVGAIVYMIYKTERDKKSGEIKKVLFETKMDIPGHGKIAVDGHYIIDKVYIETIEQGKNIQRQVYNPVELGIEE